MSGATIDKELHDTTATTSIIKLVPECNETVFSSCSNRPLQHSQRSLPLINRRSATGSGVSSVHKVRLQTSPFHQRSSVVHQRSSLNISSHLRRPGGRLTSHPLVTVRNSSSHTNRSQSTAAQLGSPARGGRSTQRHFKRKQFVPYRPDRQHSGVRSLPSRRCRWLLRVGDG